MTRAFPASLAALALWACEPNPPSQRAPSTMRTGLLVATSATTADGQTPMAARLERLRLVDGRWTHETEEDPESLVFHLAEAWDPPGPVPLSTVTLGGTPAVVRLWSADGQTRDAWRAEFTPTMSRMRDGEIGRLYGDAPAPGGLAGDVLVVGTHDEGVVAVVSPRADGSFEVTELDHRPSTFVHEIEVGDLDGDGIVEVYATLSRPNALVVGIDQPGTIVRYVPGLGRGPEVVLDLARRHAKEILVDDVDGDGRDELYAVIEARTEGTSDAPSIAEPVEVRRLTSDGPMDGEILATFDDRMARFLVAGDLEGDGHRELVLATFSTGLFRIDPPAESGGRWESHLLDDDTGGFEHATLLADLDEDGADELYVADDASGQLRRYVVGRDAIAREVIRQLPPRSVITWNLRPCPAELGP
ncbi:MAG: hypothetical protein AB7S26_32535 [Sandaracinaceae bacterium]